MLLFITNGCLFCKQWLRTFFCFDKMRGSTSNINIFRSWRYHHWVCHVGVIRIIFSVWFDPTFWSTQLIRQKGGTHTVFILTDFTALHLCPDWIGLASMQCMVELGVRVKMQLGLSLVFQIFGRLWKKLGNSISNLMGIFPALTGIRSEYSLHLENILL